MTIGSQEFIEMMKRFERDYGKGGRFDREFRDLWLKGYYYQDGKVNEGFLMWQRGYAAARCVYLNG